MDVSLISDWVPVHNLSFILLVKLAVGFWSLGPIRKSLDSRANLYKCSIVLKELEI